MKLPRAVRDQFRKFGRVGGRTRAARLSAAVRRAIARRAAVRRWVADRFGDASFSALGLPGGELVDAGLSDLAGETETIGSLLVAIAEPRLRREGVPVPAVAITDPESKLYRLLSASEGDLAHARYQAYLEQIESFSDACGMVRRARGGQFIAR